MGKSIKEFCDAYKAKNFMNTKQGVEARIEWIKKELGLVSYLPFAEKRELCETVLDACCTKEGGLVKVDSVMRYILFTISVISKYTELEFSSDEDYDSLDEYDILCESRLLNPILELIGDEYATCNNMLNMMMDDIVANNNTVEAVIGHTLGKVSDSLDGLIGAFAEKVEEMELDLSQIDIEKYFNDYEAWSGVDFQKGIKVKKYTEYSYSVYYADVGGSEYELEIRAAVDGKVIEIGLDIVRNENGYGIYEVELD